MRGPEVETDTGRPWMNMWERGIEAMRHFYRLRDDMTTNDRWHLAEVIAPDGEEPFLDDGIPYEMDEPLVIRVSHEGRPLQFCLTSFAVPVASRSVGEAVHRVADGDVELIAATISGYGEGCVLNIVRIIRCIDETRSEYVKWRKEDHRADLAGEYRDVTKLVLDMKKIPADAHMFRVGGWPVAIVVSDVMRLEMIRVGCEGAVFRLIEVSK